MERARVIGLGERVAGDDGVALFVVERLRELLSPTELDVIELLTTQDPTRLLEWLRTPMPVWLVDAVVGAEKPGQVLELSPAAFSEEALSSVSSHGVNPMQALRLCSTLFPDEVCPRLTVLALTIDAPRRRSVGLSDAVRRAGETCAVRLATHLSSLISEHPRLE